MFSDFYEFPDHGNVRDARYSIKLIKPFPFILKKRSSFYALKLL